MNQTCCWCRVPPTVGTPLGRIEEGALERLSPPEEAAVSRVLQFKQPLAADDEHTVRIYSTNNGIATTEDMDGDVQTQMVRFALRMRNRSQDVLMC